MPTTKKCKGTTNATKGFGCGKELPYTEKNGIRSYKAKYGLGLDCRCLHNWAITNEKGKKWLKKQSISNMQKKEKKERIEKTKMDRKMKIELMSTSEYWSKVFQLRFNELIRLVDNGNGCICTNSTLGKMNAGHFYSVGSNKTLSLNAHNVHIQSEHSNNFKGGQPLEYRDGIKRVFGEEYLEFMENLKRCPALNITKIELIGKHETVLRLKREFKAGEYFCLSPMERIEMRNHINTELGLCPDDFSEFDITKII